MEDIFSRWFVALSVVRPWQQGFGERKSPGAPTVELGLDLYQVQMAEVQMYVCVGETQRLRLNV